MTSSTNADEATVNINVNDLRASKDAVLLRLTALQTYIADLTKATLEHSDLLIKGVSSIIDLPPVPAALSGKLDAVSPVAQPIGGKKRKRAPADPNAPKRALTPYFLYMQHTRQTIADELGSEAKPKDVSDEGTRRWKAMDEPTRAMWKDKYAENYREYKEVLETYKSDKLRGGPKVETKVEAEVETEADPADQLMNDAAASDASSDPDPESSSEDESDEEPMEPVKEKTPPRSTSKRARRTTEKAKETPVKQTSPPKRSRAKKADAETAVPASESKRKSKKRKSEV